MSRLTILKLAAAALVLGVFALWGFAPAQARVSAPRASQAYPPPGTPPANDNFANAKVVTNMPFQEYVALGAATAEAQEPTPSCAYSLVTSVWYAFTPSSSGLVSTGSTYSYAGTVTAVYTGSSLGSLSQVACQSGSLLTTFQATAGTTYYIQLSSAYPYYGVVSFAVQPPPAPAANPYYYPQLPSRYDTVQFSSGANDPAGLGIASQTWSFGDGAIATGPAVSHRYAADGDYTVRLTVVTTDGRSATFTLPVKVITHDVAITRFSTPNTGSSGQTRSISVDVAANTYPEKVQVTLYKSVAGFPGTEVVGTLTQSVPLRSSGRAVGFDFSYTFTPADADLGKVTFKAVASVVGGSDALPADNEAVATTKVNR